MSIVLCYADKNRAIIASDGRIIDNKGNIINESFRKFFRINSKVLLGYAGDLGPCESVAMLFKKQPEKFLNKLSFNNVYEFILQYCESFPSNTRYGFILCGISEGKIAVANITPYISPSKQYMKGSEPYFSELGPEEIRGKNIFASFLLKQKPEAAIKSTIEYCARISKSVNHQVFLDQVLL